MVLAMQGCTEAGAQPALCYCCTRDGKGHMCYDITAHARRVRFFNVVLTCTFRENYVRVSPAASAVRFLQLQQWALAG
jgi:hypothetical protein